MRLSLIVAMTRQGVIGRAGTLPWRLSADLRRFKALTMGHTIVMGRKTWDSLGRPLPGRTSFVLTRRTDFAAPPGVVIADNLADAVYMAAKDDDEVFIIGGGEIFAEALHRADRLYVTWVEADVPGDTYFPAWDQAEWRLVESERHSADERNEYDTTFAVYDRVTHPD